VLERPEESIGDGIVVAVYAAALWKPYLKALAEQAGSTVHVLADKPVRMKKFDSIAIPR
jgi:hypothetical protein